MDDEKFRRLYWMHYIVQTVVGVVIAVAVVLATEGWLPRYIHIFVCNVIIGPC